MEGSTILAWIGIFGVVTGFRSMLPMAVLCYYTWHNYIPMPAHWQFLGNLWFVIFMSLVALAELGADKWRGMPNRTAPLGLLTRILMGTIAGAALASSTYIGWWKGSLTCAGLALVGAAIGYSLRQYFREATRAPDSYIGVGEDFLTFIGAVWVLEHLS